MEFKQIEAFVNVVKYRSFSKAADASFLTQPTVSTHISSLEKELGVTLVERLGKESRPTKQGREFYKYALNLLNTREKAIMAVSDAGQKLSGVVELQASSVPGMYILPKLMAAFREENPDARFYLEVSDSKTVWNNMQENKGELGFTGDFRGNSLGCENLCRDESVLITPKNARFSALREKSAFISGKDFLDEEFIWREEGSASRNTTEEKLCKRRGAKLNIAATVNSLEAVKQCVGEGLGISVISGIAAEADADKADYLTFRFSDLELDREYYLVYNRGITLSPIASRFRDFVLSCFTKQGESSC